jgi:hypothetical protein
VRRLPFLVLLVLVLSATDALGASRARLYVSIKPATPRIGQHFKIVISGHYPGTGTRYLYGFLEGPSRCKADARSEVAAYGEQPVIHEAGSSSPFSLAFGYTATATSRHTVCAYLYSRHVGSGKRVKPIAMASASFRITP